MDTVTLLALLRRLAHAQPAHDSLQLPAGLSPQEAIQAIRAAVRALEPPPSPHSRALTGSEVLRVHIDGASRGNPGPAGIGVLLVGPDGAVIERLHRGIGEATNNVAEYSALIAALERAAAIGAKDIEVYSDSELLVRQIQGRYQIKHPALRRLYAMARKYIADLRHFAIRHVPRERNAEADALANRGIDEAARGVRCPKPAPDDGEGA